MAPARTGVVLGLLVSLAATVTTARETPASTAGAEELVAMAYRGIYADAAKRRRGFDTFATRRAWIHRQTTDKKAVPRYSFAFSAHSRTTS